MAIQLHDTGWGRVDEERILSEGFSGDWRKAEIRFEHERQGCAIAREVLPHSATTTRSSSRSATSSTGTTPEGGVLAGGRAGPRRRPAVALRPRRDRTGLRLVPHGPRGLQ
ncbi:hypothetical protein ACR6C2_44755 [Streptomyces sp. INA 01156]